MADAVEHRCGICGRAGAFTLEAHVGRRRKIEEEEEEMSSISDEILKVANEYDVLPLYKLADRIDAEMVELPKDADGEPIHIGDVMDSKVDYLFDGKPFTVRALVLCKYGWEVADGRFGNRYKPDSLRHHHEPTVEDVLREFAEKIIDSQVPGVHPTYEEAIAECAAKLRLAEGEEQ